MTISAKDKVLNSDMTAGNFKVALAALLEQIENIADDKSLIIDFDQDTVLRHNDAEVLFDPLGKFLPPEPGQDLDGDGIPDNIPPHILPYVRSIVQLRAQNAVFRSRMLDALMHQSVLEGFAQSLISGNLKIRQ